MQILKIFKGGTVMEYVTMTLEEAKRVAKKNAIVLIAKQDLERECNVGFTKKKFCECSELLQEAETIAKVCDDFAAQLRCFTTRQVDPINYKPVGTLNTILFRSN
jgi:hypothetical protein